MQAKEEFKDLWHTLQLLLTLSHSQAAVERGFSVNKEVLAPNMQEVSLQAIRLIHSSMLAQETSVADFVISEELLSSCNCCDMGQNDTIGKIELNPSFILSSDNTNCKNDIQLFHQLFDELRVNGDCH